MSRQSAGDTGPDRTLTLVGEFGTSASRPVLDGTRERQDDFCSERTQVGALMSAAADDEKMAFDESCAAARELSHNSEFGNAIANKKRKITDRG
jgi:hypothetical protein